MIRKRKGKLEVIGKGLKESRAKVRAAHKRAGGSDVGKYKNTPKGDFVGTDGGAPRGSYPDNTKKRAKAALRYAHYAPDPAGIREAIFRKYPSLKKK